VPILKQVILYDEHTAPTLDVSELARHLRELTGCPQVEVRGSFLLEHSTPERWPELARGIARLKVRNPDAPFREAEPAYAEVEFERRRLANEDRGPFGIMYDGFGLQLLMRGMGAAGVGPCVGSLPTGMAASASPRLSHTPALHTCQIAFTNRLVGTWDDGDLRYHLRTVILGIPAIISTTGLVEAPAKPREFYLAQQQLGPAGRSEYALALLKEQFRGRFLDHDDPLLTEIAKGYAMQSIAYQLTGEAFCDDPDCRLFNAHWQEEMMRAQLGTGQERAPAQRSGEYCPRHAAWLEGLRQGSA